MRNFNDFIKQNNNTILRVLLILIFFILPFNRGMPLSIVPIQDIEMRVNPLGYPPNGMDWQIQIFGSKNHLDYFVLTDCLVEVNTSNGKKYQIFTDENGECKFTYYNSYGEVAIQAIYNPSLWISFRPQTQFIRDSLAHFIIAFYGIGVPTFFWEFHNKIKKSSKSISGLIVSISRITYSIGWIATLFWFITWKMGSEWGYGNRIFHLYIDFNINPHLMYLTCFNILLLFTYPILLNKQDINLDNDVDIA